MINVLEILARLQRPRLLIRAARHGAAEYEHVRGRRRLLSSDGPLDTETAFTKLLEAEAQVEEDRKLGHATYSIPHHIDLLAALIGEARTLARPGQHT